MDTPRARQRHWQVSPAAEALTTALSWLGLLRDDPPLGAVEVWKAERECWTVPPAHQEQQGRKEGVSRKASQNQPRGLMSPHPNAWLPGEKSLEVSTIHFTWSYLYFQPGP